MPPAAGSTSVSRTVSRTTAQKTDLSCGHAVDRVSDFLLREDLDSGGDGATRGLVEGLDEVGQAVVGRSGDGLPFAKNCRASTSPAGSCPTIVGSIGGYGNVPLVSRTSLPHGPSACTRMSTSPGPGTGVGTTAPAK